MMSKIDFKLKLFLLLLLFLSFACGTIHLIVTKEGFTFLFVLVILVILVHPNLTYSCHLWVEHCWLCYLTLSLRVIR